jgi:hypothetical protein
MKTIQIAVTLGDDALQAIVELLGKALSEAQQRSAMTNVERLDCVHPNMHCSVARSRPRTRDCSSASTRWPNYLSFRLEQFGACRMRAACHHPSALVRQLVGVIRPSSSGSRMPATLPDDSLTRYELPTGEPCSGSRCPSLTCRCGHKTIMALAGSFIDEQEVPRAVQRIPRTGILSSQ